ncbi:MAG: hypothetical protein IT507_10985 [Burkholderiaceae bacterium]|nr:hypothetical protein [Burkholderiaceae bacterium]
MLFHRFPRLLSHRVLSSDIFNGISSAAPFEFKRIAHLAWGLLGARTEKLNQRAIFTRICVARGKVLQYDQPASLRRLTAPVRRFDPDCTLAFSPQSQEEYQCLIVVPAFV